MAGIDSNAYLVLKGDGADGVTTMLDSSLVPKVLTTIGAVEIDTAHSAFGNSIQFKGGVLRANDHADFALGSSNFTFEGKFTFDNIGTSRYFFMQSDGANVIYFLWYQPTPMLSFQIYNGGPAFVFNSPAWSPVVNQEYYIRLKRNGTTITLEVNGVVIASTSIFTAIPDVNAPLYIGGRSDGTGHFSGWWDEVRFSKVARNDTYPMAEFTPPAPVVPPTPPAVGVSEAAYWADEAALLDPNAYVYVRGTNFDIVKDHPVMLTNAWRLNFDGGPNTLYFHRPADINNATRIPAGTHLKIVNPVGGYVLYCDPTLVNADPRYADGRDLYYYRKELLKKIKPRTLQASIPQGWTVNDIVAAGASAPNVVPFPTDFENGLIVGLSIMDGCWATLDKHGPTPNESNILNLFDEINDVQSFRGSSGNTFIPFKRSMFSHLSIGFGSVFAGKCAGVGSPHIYCQADGEANDIVPIYPDKATFNEQACILYYNLDELTALGHVW